MKKRFHIFTMTIMTVVMVVLAVLLAGGSLSAEAKRGTIFNGVTIDGIDLSGMTVEEAEAAVEAYLDEMFATEISLIAAQGNAVHVRIEEFSPEWTNRAVIDDIIGLAAGGNVVQRYKISRDIEYNGTSYSIELSYDDAKIRTILTEQCSVYDVPVENATLSRENGQFVVIPGQTGQVVDLAASETALLNYLNGRTFSLK